MTASTSGLRDVWRGGVATWECDEMGHMNTRFYVARCVEAAAMLFGLSGLPRLFAPGSDTTLAIRTMHIRFLREARAGTSMHISAGFTSVGDGTAEVVAMMFDSASGECAATFRIGLGHIAVADRTARAWPEAVATRIADELVETPKLAMPRGTGELFAETSASGARADELSLRQLGQGAVLQPACDNNGKMLPHAFVGAIADSVRNIITPLRELCARHSDRGGPHFGAAALEFLIRIDDLPGNGDCWEVRSGLARADGRTMDIVNWMLDPFSGHAFGTMEVVAICFDLETRRLLPIAPAAQAELAGWIVPGLAL
ncbi:thioesterase family protein [Aminobacter sp. AP02]|uniref:thioesterase family protein n=1 Tax=Aminobacter sp. AP02 TaxID=2135737 RepID=UPI000D6C3428|nr:thioesterase family protein [Aminobacter sp. AP02]PWK76139.1 acyl-CoA thioester hydrolase [Aminobacter sp. AP02]